MNIKKVSLKRPFLLIIISFISLAFNIIVQKADTKIYWSTEKLLTWDDFQGKAQANSTNAAISSTGIIYSPAPKQETGKLEIDIICYFDKKKSWVKINSKDETGLKHEQGHFNISEIYARKFRKTVIGCKLKTKTWNDKLQKLYSQNHIELNKYQDLYDKETDHYRNQQKQIEWNEKIAKELKELDDYIETHLVINIK